MWSFILWIRDSFISLSTMLNAFHFNIAGMSISLLDIMIGFLAMGIVISVFWKGARS